MIINSREWLIRAILVLLSVGGCAFADTITGQPVRTDVGIAAFDSAALSPASSIVADTVGASGSVVLAQVDFSLSSRGTYGGPFEQGVVVALSVDGVTGSASLEFALLDTISIPHTAPNGGPFFQNHEIGLENIAGPVELTLASGDILTLNLSAFQANDIVLYGSTVHDVVPLNMTYDVSASPVNPSSVPEPSSVLLLGTGLLGGIGAMRRRLKEIDEDQERC